MSENIHGKIFQKRRKIKHRTKRPWYKKLGLRIEEYNKRLTVGLLGKLLRTRNVDHPIDFSKINSVLILRHDAIGDMVVTTPFWRILKKQAPHIRIGVACSLRNRDVLRCDPDVDEIYDMSVGDIKHILQSVKHTRAGSWDICVQAIYARKTKGAVIARLAAPKSATSILTHENVDRYKHLFSIVGHSPKVGDRMVPMVELLKVHFEAIFKYKPSYDEWHPSVIIDPKRLASAWDKLSALYQQTGTSRFLLINTEAQATFKEWGYKNALELAKRMEKSHPDSLVLLTSSPNTRPALEAFLASHEKPDRLHSFPTEDLHELMALVRYSSLVISPDTSVVHLATAEHKPTIAVFLHHNEWEPYHVPSKVISPKMHDPVSTIPVETVLEAVKELLPMPHQ